jgi:3-oxoacyl-[acyl-carrier-protein] synthase II
MTISQVEKARVAITGAGIVTPIGANVKEFVESLRNGVCNIRTLSGIPMPRGKANIGLVSDPAFDGPDRGFRMAAAATTEALAQANSKNDFEGDIALILSTIGGDSRAAEDLYERFVNTQVFDHELSYALRLYPNGAILNSLGDQFGLWGPRFVVTNACASGNIALGMALDMIRLGHCMRVVVVGVENVKLSMIWGAERAGFIGHSLRPFHTKRDGSVLGEGAAALVLERADLVHDKLVLGWLEGFGCVCDKGAAPITLLEDGSGLYRSMACALEDAGRLPHELEYVNAHAPGTRLIDLIECKAVANLCGEHTNTIAINATKSMTTHLSGASAIVEVIATLMQMHKGFLHPTVGLDEPDPALAITPIGLQSVPRHVTRAISNACGGGGLNTSVMITAPQEPETRSTTAHLDSDSRIVISGTGQVSALGFGATVPITTYDTVASHPLTILDWFNIYDWYPETTNYSYMNRAAQLAAASAKIAISDADLPISNGMYQMDRVAVIAGTYLGGGPEASDVMCQALLHNPNGIKPSMSLDHGLHLGAALVSRYFGYTGSTHTLTGTITAALQAVFIARNLLLADRADMAIVMGYDALDQPLQRAFSLLGGCPGGDRLGEGAGAVVLERFALAQKRRAPRSVVLHEAVLLSGSLRTLSAIRSLADRLASRLHSTDWEVLYLAAPLDQSEDILARYFMAAVGKSTPIKRLHTWTNHCFAADSMFALGAAVASQEQALVLSAESAGIVAALVLGPS